MNINALLISSIFDNKKTFGRFYELILQNEIERILEKLYPVELAGLHLERNSEYYPCDFSKSNMKGQIPNKQHVEVKLKSFRKGVFEDTFPTINTITSAERDYFEEVLMANAESFCFIVLYFHENNSLYLVRITNVSVMIFAPWKNSYAIIKERFMKIKLAHDYRLKMSL